MTSSPKDSFSPQTWVTAAWPAAAGLVYAAYALAPHRFPADTGLLLALLLLGEFILMLSTVGYGMALGERTRTARYLVFALGLIICLPLLWMIDPQYVMPMVGWVLIGQVLSLWSTDPDPELARARVFAVLNDKASLLELVPVVFVGTFLTTGLAVAIGGYFGWDLERWLRNHLDVSHWAFIGTVYLLMSAWITGHANGPAFARHRRRLLDLPALRAISRFLGRGSALPPRDL